MCLKLLFSSVDLFFSDRKLEFDGVDDTTQDSEMDCEESADAITEIRPMGRNPFNRQASDPIKKMKVTEDSSCRQRSISTVTNPSPKPNAVEMSSADPEPVPTIGRKQRSKSLYEMSDQKPREYEQLNNYILKEVLGNGSYGIVKQCTDQSTNVDYAIKIISKKKIKAKAGFSGRSLKGPPRRQPPGRKPSTSSNPLDKIHMEIAILKKCEHDNIVNMVEVIDDTQSPEQNIYLVFELMSKGQVMEEPNMGSKAQVPPLPEQTCKRFFRDLLLGLEYLHYQKIIHRDIKPSNLLLGGNGELKIADFGVSEIFEGDRAVIKNSAGSPAFLPPEAVDPDITSFDGQLLDIWACGVTLWIFCFGRVPFRGDSILKLHENIREAKLVFPESEMLNDSLKDLFQRLLAKSVDDRISIEEAKSHPWVTDDGQITLKTSAQNCNLVEVSDAEIANAVTCIKWGTMMRIYNIARNRSFKLRSDRKSRSLPKTPADNVQNSMGELHIEEPTVT